MRQLLFMLVAVSFSAATGTSATVGHRPPPPRPFCVSCRIVDLNAIVGRGPIAVIPTAINNVGQIVAYNGVSGTSAAAGVAYLIDPDLSFVSFGQGFTFTVPTAISNNGKSIVGDTTFTDTYGLIYESLAVWTLPSPRLVNLAYFGYPYTPGDDFDFKIASDEVPVAGHYYYGFSSFSPNKFPTSGCAITDFLARAINDNGTIVGSGGGYAAYGSTTGCAKPIPIVRPANGFTQADAINSAGDLLVSLTGMSAPAYGATYVVKGGRLSSIPLPSTRPNGQYYLVARAISDADEVVGDVRSQIPPFSSVAPFMFRNGVSFDLNSFLPRDSGWTLLTASGVSLDGAVIGTGYHDGVLSGYVLYP